MRFKYVIFFYERGHSEHGQYYFRRFASLKAAQAFQKEFVKPFPKIFKLSPVKQLNRKAAHFPIAKLKKDATI